MTSKSTEKKAAKKQTRRATAKPKPPTPPADGGPADTKPTGSSAPATRKATPPQPDSPQDEMVVFAFRLTRAERDLIHQAAGSAKASKFIRSLALAAASGDAKAVKEAMATVQSTT